MIAIGRATLFAGLIVFSGYLFFVPSYSQAVECPAGQVPITSETRKAATAANVPESSPCWDPNDPHIGMNAGQAKQYLISLPRNGQTASPKHIQMLTDTFAICAARFFKAYIPRHGSVTITSAYRDEKSGENKRVGGVPGSNHTRGMAIDVHPANGNYDSMMNFARANPHLGVCFPRPQYRNKPDLPHMILAGIGGREAARCAAQNITKQCSGAPPTNITDTPPSGPPSQQITQVLRDLFQPQQQPQQQAGQIPPGYCIRSLTPLEIIPCPQQPQQQPQAPQQQYPQQQQLQPPQPGSSVPGGQNLSGAFGQPQQTQAGQTIPSGISSSQVKLPTSTAESEEKPKKSAYEQISEWVFGTETEKGETTEPLKLTTSVKDAVKLNNNGASSKPAQSTSTKQINAPVYSEQTFTTPDLASVAKDNAAKLAAYQSFLEKIKQTLLTMLAYLKPFGRPNDNNGYME